MSNEKTEKLLKLLAERVSSLERIVKLQHEELGKVYEAVAALQTAFEKLVAPAQNAECN